MGYYSPTIDVIPPTPFTRLRKFLLLQLTTPSLQLIIEEVLGMSVD
jgi:hypothetical protein